MDKNKQNLRAVTIALRNITLLPKATIHFDITRKKSIAAVEKAMGEDERVFLITQTDPDVREPKLGDLYKHGTFAAIKQIARLQQGYLRITAEGLFRAKINNIISDVDYIVSEISPDNKEDKALEKYDEVAKEAMCRIVKEQFSSLARADRKLSLEVSGMNEIKDLNELLIKIAAGIPWDYKIKQGVLDAADYVERYEIVVRELSKENQIMHVKSNFQNQLKENMDNNHKEYVLREQLKIIHSELGGDEYLGEIQEYEKKLAKLRIDEEDKLKLKKEIQRLKTMQGSGQEANTIRTYLDTVFDIPFGIYTIDNTDIRSAAKILEDEHYGLEKVKERVIEYLAVRILNSKGKGPILCLVGPPGTGKTSIAKSIAKALGKEYIRISLGGIRDEAEIRGHRKTYVGAMPGRLVEGLRQAGVSNPLMLLDEIDKASNDYKGDTFSALLEVLDAEQNHKFRDHFIEIPINLSQVLFVATANTTATIPRPLLDRMEIIEISSYTENEKFHIAQKYLLRKQLEANGLDSKQVDISDEAIAKIIHSYTREAGVRNLERCIGEVYRKCARAILEGRKRKIKIGEKQVKNYLGKEKYNFGEAAETDEIGVVRGLAWTSVGGDTLQIEVNVLPGKGGLVLTGQMGSVMKESAQIALSCIKACTLVYKIPEGFFDRHDLHLHIPEGAVPKDGPSAGISMATAMLSAVTLIPVRADTAMTGEITLRGRVLPIGGLKEKVLAAKTAGIKNVIVPLKNKPDIEELSNEITEGLKIIYVRDFSEVIKNTLITMPVRKNKKAEKKAGSKKAQAVEKEL